MQAVATAHCCVLEVLSFPRGGGSGRPLGALD